MIAIISIFPIGKGEGLSGFVAGAVALAAKSGLDYRLTAMGTIVEGEWEPVMKLVKKMRDLVLARSNRIYLTISIDDRKQTARRLEAKIKAVEKKLVKTLKK